MVAVVAFAPVVVLAQSADAPPADTKDGSTITIKASKPSVTNKIDRRVYDVSTNPQSAFSTASDVLQRIPSVTIDPRGRIALRGDPEVKVLIDGVESRSGALGNLQASEIDRIEVMTNPSAQFASDGSGGIINIILKKKRKDGVNGNAGIRGDDDGRYNINLGFNTKRGRWTWGTSAGTSRTQQDTAWRGHQQWGTETTNGITLSDMSRRSAYANASLAFDATERDRVELNLSHYRWRAATREDGTVLIKNAAGQVIDDHGEYVFNSESGHGSEWSAHFQHKGAVEGETLDLNVSYNSGTSSDSAWHRLIGLVPTPSDIAYAYFNEGPDGGMNFKADYERPFGKSRLNAGFEIETNESESLGRSQNLAALVPGESDAATPFLYDRATKAAYVTLQTPLGKWAIMPGLRVEAERWTAGPAETSDLRWLPSLNLNRKLSDRTRLVASYSHRTQRPNGYQLNPRLVYYGRYYTYEGNPYLKAQETDAYEIGYEFEGKDFSSNGSLYYRVKTHPTTQTRRVVGQVVMTSVANADEARAMGLELTAKGKVSEKIDYSVNLNVFDSEISGLFGGEALKRQYVTYSGNAVIDWRPNAKDWLQFNLNTEGRAVQLQGYQTGFYRLDMVYRHKITPKWTFSVRAFDLLNSSKQETVFETPQGGSRVENRTERPGIMIGVNRKFGKGGPE
ncbi:pesticin receptor [Asticcacaulis biprosthecium C19]|uniref:Pesticin receptor n=1 Tax=Asticcacaulis biprosthecium C19 TaxID=715226 RepID=F4QN70_9CAUL|nr:pesticin receptor [Asticcacaulis biprosthecium C19]